MKPITIRLPHDLAERIQILEGGKQRQLAKFIREAVEKELQRRERGSAPED